VIAYRRSWRLRGATASPAGGSDLRKLKDTGPTEATLRTMIHDEVRAAVREAVQEAKAS
jgi:hypothetical protein